MRNARWITFAATAVLLIAGCASKPPTIAHTHIGHAITGCVETPGQTGLLVTAEKEAAAVVSNADQAVAGGNDLTTIKQSVNEVMHALSPDIAPDGTAGLGFGLLPAVRETVSHMEFAAESDDASQNVRDSVPRIVERSRAIIGKCDEIEVLGGAVTASRSAKSPPGCTRRLAAKNSPIRLKRSRCGASPAASSHGESFHTQTGRTSSSAWKPWSEATSTTSSSSSVATISPSARSTPR